MAAIFKVKRKTGEVHVYHNRVPRKDGSEPLLGWMLIACMVLAVIVGDLVVIAVIYNSGIPLDLPHSADPQFDMFMSVLFLCFSALLLAGYICSKFSKRIFSPREQRIYSGFLFFRRRIADFADIGDITLSQQEFLGKTRYRYVATWRKNRLKKPLPLSPKAKSLNRLARYYHSVAPLLLSMLPDRDMAGDKEPVQDGVDEVGVETVEVPVDEAVGYLAASHGGSGMAGEEENSPASGCPDFPAKREIKKVVFTEKNGIYSSNQILMAVGVMLLLLPGVVLWGISFASAIENKSLRLGYYVFHTGLVLYGIRMMALENVRTVIDPQRRIIVLTLWYGLRKKEFGFDALRKFTVKRLGGLKILCMVLEGQRVDPTLAHALSDKRMQAAIDEVCGIMGLDPDAWLSE